MTRMTGPDCAVMCNLINTHTHTHCLKKNLNASRPSEHPTQGEKCQNHFRVSPTNFVLIVCVCVCVCVCVFIKLHITAQSGPVILIILCHSH